MQSADGIIDCAIIGGGIAGLTAAWRLKLHDICVLEALPRPGGRLHSTPRDPYWLNFGAHMFGDETSLVGQLVAELGLEARPIRGALIGMSYRGRRLLNAPVTHYPLRLPLPLSARLSFVKMGLALKRGSARTVKALPPRQGETPAETRARMIAFEGERTLLEQLGSLHPDVLRLLTAITERTGGDPSEMSAGYALRSFTNVWSQHAPGRNLVGGSARLPETLAARLGDRILYETRVDRIERAPHGVTITCQTPAGTEVIRARTAIVAVPAPVAREIIADLPQATSAALSKIRYGAFLSAAVLTGETGPMPWDGNYAISTPERSFSVVFNQATTLRTTAERWPGGSLMLFRGARGAARLMEESDQAIEDRFRADLLAEFPESRGLIREIIVQRWPNGAPYCFPGRAQLQADLTADLGPIRLAGDYLEFPNMEAASQTGIEAAAHVTQVLGSRL